MRRASVIEVFCGKRGLGVRYRSEYEERSDIKAPGEDENPD
jgi:hypothetical protein